MILSNRVSAGRGMRDAVLIELARFLTGRELPALPAIRDFEPDALERLEGTYFLPAARRCGWRPVMVG